MKRSTLILLTIVLSLLAFIFFVERKGKTTREIIESKDKIFSVFQDEVLEIERKGFEEIKIVKIGKDYKILSPLTDIADTGSVNGFIEALKNAKMEREIKESVDLEKIGLLKPKIELLLKTKSNEFKLEIGSNPPLEKGSYFKCGNKIGVLSEYTLDTLKRGLNDFRSKDLCAPLKPENVKEISYIKGSNLYLDLKNFGNEWKVTCPFFDDANERNTLFFIEDIVLWPVMGFEDETVDDKTTKINEPSETIKIKTDTDGEINIKIGSLKDQEKRFYYASVSNRKGIFVISKNSVRNIDKGPEEFRSLKVFPSDLSLWKRLEISGKEKIIFSKDKEKKWTDNSKKLKEEQIETFLYSLSYLEGERKINKEETLPVFAEIKLTDNNKDLEIIFYEGKDVLIAEIKERKIFVSISKEDSERIKGAFSTIYSHLKEGVSN